MTDLQKITEINKIKQKLHDLELGVRYAQNQEITDKVSKDIYKLQKKLKRNLEELETSCVPSIFRRENLN